jgi:hypothetical protein
MLQETCQRYESIALVRYIQQLHATGDPPAPGLGRLGSDRFDPTMPLRAEKDCKEEPADRVRMPLVALRRPRRASSAQQSATLTSWTGPTRIRQVQPDDAAWAPHGPQGTWRTRKTGSSHASDLPPREFRRRYGHGREQDYTGGPQEARVEGLEGDRGGAGPVAQARHRLEFGPSESRNPDVGEASCGEAPGDRTRMAGVYIQLDRTTRVA